MSKFAKDVILAPGPLLHWGNPASADESQEHLLCTASLSVNHQLGLASCQDWPIMLHAVNLIMNIN